MKYQKLFYILMFSPLVVSVIALCFLPDFIPAHYNLKNTVDRWGSKYELLIFPIITILFGQFLLLLGKMAKKQKTQGNNNEKMSLLIGNCSLLIFNILSGIMIYSSVTKAENLSFFLLNLDKWYSLSWVWFSSSSVISCQNWRWIVSWDFVQMEYEKRWGVEKMSKSIGYDH